MMKRFAQNYRLLERVRLIDMPGDPDPVPVGTVGTIIGAGAVEELGIHRQVQLFVDWDNGRKLHLVPEDTFEIVSPAFGKELSFTKADVLELIEQYSDATDGYDFRQVGDLDLSKLTDERMHQFIDEIATGAAVRDATLSLAKGIEKV